MKKIPLIFILFLIIHTGIFSQALLIDNFSYTIGTSLTSNGYTLQGNATPTAQLLVANGGLTYPSYTGSGIGNSVQLDGTVNGEDNFKAFITPAITSGSVYVSLLANISSASTAGEYFIANKIDVSTSGTASIIRARLYVRGDGAGGISFGIAKGTLPPEAGWTTFSYSTGVTYLLVYKYTFVDGTTNDNVVLFINPVIGNPEPSPTISYADLTTNDAAGMRSVLITQRTAGATALVDGLRVATSWADAVALDNSAPVATFVPADGATDVLADAIPVITFNEPVLKADGSPLINSDLATLVIFKLNNASGANVAFTATINDAKTVITVTPSAALNFSQQYYLAVGPVKDGAGNLSGTQSSAFTTISDVISDDATISDLRVDNVTISGFSPSIYNYTQVVPYGLPTAPAVTATTSYPLATAVITPAASMPGVTTIVVTAQDGVTQLTYLVEFTYGPPSTNSALSYIKWLPNGLDPVKQNIRVRGFDPAVFDYNIDVPIETVSLVVDAEPDFVIPASGCPPATYTVEQPVNLTGSPAERTATIVCTAQDGIITSTYHVTFSKAPVSNYYLFKQGFDIMPPAGWLNTANVGSSPTNGLGFYGSLSAYATPKFKWLTPADGGTLTTPPCNGATTLEFFVKVLDKSPASNLHLYIEKSYDNTSWTLVSQDPMPLYATITQWHQVVLQVNDLNPQIYFRFRAAATTGDNSTGLFYLDDVSLTMNASVDATLSDLRVEGTTIAGFAPEIVSYDVVLPIGTTSVPDVSATTSQSGASAVVTDASGLPGSTTVLVTASNNINTLTYSVNFSVMLSAPSNLEADIVSGSQVDISWNDINSYENGFSIERKPNEGLFSQVATVGANVTTFSDPLTFLDPDQFVAANRFPNVTVTSGIKFADVTNYQGIPTSLYLDVYKPTGDNTQGRPVIIWIHGGGFRTGSVRTQGYIVDYCTRFAKRGYVCMSIDYRLRAAADMPEQEDEYPALQDAARDANAAISWVKANAAAYNIDPNLIFIAGGSAGGRTAITVCQFDGPDPTALYPPENLYLTTPWNKTGLIANATLWGGLEPEMRGWVYPYLQPTDIPTILVHGTADVTILPIYSQQLHDTLTDAGVTSELHLIPGATHSCLGHETDIAAWIAAFFAQEWNLRNESVSYYTYRVRAYNAISYSGYSNEALAMGNAVWTGNTSSSWSTPSNWMNGILPSLATYVTIPSTGVPNFPVVSNPVSAPAGAYTIELQNGAALHVAGTLIIKQP